MSATPRRTRTTTTASRAVFRAVAAISAAVLLAGGPIAPTQAASDNDRQTQELCKQSTKASTNLIRVRVKSKSIRSHLLRTTRGRGHVRSTSSARARVTATNTVRVSATADACPDGQPNPITVAKTRTWTAHETATRASTATASTAPKSKHKATSHARQEAVLGARTILRRAAAQSARKLGQTAQTQALADSRGTGTNGPQPGDPGTGSGGGLDNTSDIERFRQVLRGELLARHNAERAAVGAQPLRSFAPATAFAQEWAQKQADAHPFSEFQVPTSSWHHPAMFPPAGIESCMTPQQWISDNEPDLGGWTGENVGMYAFVSPPLTDAAARQVANGVMTSWMSSPGHKSAVLLPKANAVGFGVGLKADSNGDLAIAVISDFAHVDCPMIPN
jgi:uncharacterized protein YkwD